MLSIPYSEQKTIKTFFILYIQTASKILITCVENKYIDSFAVKMLSIKKGFMEAVGLNFKEKKTQKMYIIPNLYETKNYMISY